MKIPIAIILGPTGVGKTKLSLELAPLLNAEIISMDSMLVYKDMDIGTAKPSLEERRKVKHHLIDIVPPDYPFTSAEFKERAEKAIFDIYKRGKIPLLVGGTAFYYKVLLGDFSIPKVPPDYELRKILYKEIEEKGEEYLYEKLKEIDPISALKIHPHDHKRIIRALEVYYKSGIPKSVYDKKNEEKYYVAIIGLYIPKDVHYRILDDRIEKMIKNGLVEEVKRLWERGIDENYVSMQGIGYKEIILYLKGKYSLEQAIELIKKRTRLFVKRQYTWFKKDKRIIWFNVLEFSLSQLRDLVYTTILRVWKEQGFNLKEGW